MTRMACFHQVVLLFRLALVFCLSSDLYAQPQDLNFERLSIAQSPAKWP